MTTKQNQELQEAIDEIVHDICSEQVASINNGGGQISFICSHGRMGDLVELGVDTGDFAGSSPMEEDWQISDFLGQEPEDFKVLEVNSGHIPLRDHYLLSSMGKDNDDGLLQASGLIVYLVLDMPQVYLVNLPEVDRTKIDLDKATWAILDAAAAAGYRRVEFDGSGEVYPNLPKFDW